MSVFIDTSAFLAVMNADDQEHQRAGETWAGLLNGSEVLVTSSYVLVETIALLQRRLGLAAIEAFQMDVIPVLDVAWVGEEIHALAMSDLLTDARRYLSLVDCVSFQTMRRLNITRAFCFDRHFQEKGFTVMPS